LEGQHATASLCQILSKLLKQIAQFNGFKNSSNAPSWIFELPFLTVRAVKRPKLNFDKISQTVSEISGFCNVQYGSRHHLGFSQIQNSNGWSAVVGQYAGSNFAISQ